MQSNFQLWVLLLVCISICGCTAAKLEARMEANPQCKEIINPKTGALMPCPGTDRSFYRSVGLESAKSSIPPVVTNSTEASAVLQSQSSTSTALSHSATSAARSSVSSDCKPQLHKKTGSVLPCPSQD